MATRTTQFFYDAVSNRTKVVYPDSRTTYYTYDKANRLTDELSSLKSCPFCVTALLLVVIGCSLHQSSFDAPGLENIPLVTNKRSFRFIERNIKGLYITSLQELTALSDEEVDIATAVLLVSREFDFKLDTKKYLSIIDNMALELAEELKKPLTPRQVADAFRQYLFVEKKFAAFGNMKELEQYTGYGRRRLHQIDGVLDTRKGDCWGLSLLYLCLAERLGVPMYFFAIPGATRKFLGHAFIRYVDGDQKFNVDPVGYGKVIPTEWYERRFEANLRFWPDCLEKPLRTKELIAQFCCQLYGIIDSEGGDLKTARRIIKISSLFMPNHPSPLTWLADIELKRGRMGSAVRLLRKAVELAPRDFAVNFSAFIVLIRRFEFDSAIEFAKEFLQVNPQHPAADIMRLGLYCFLAQSELPTKYRFESLEEVERAIEFVKGYRKKHPEPLFEQEEAPLEALPSLLQKRKQELLQDKQK